METTKKTRLEAFIEAQKTGQIAIKPKTARNFTDFIAWYQRTFKKGGAR